mgnify:CR=1 FL=1
MKSITIIDFHSFRIYHILFIFKYNYNKKYFFTYNDIFCCSIFFLIFFTTLHIALL